MRRTATTLLCSLALLSALPQVSLGQARRPNPFQPPTARLHYAPDRTCDLIHVQGDLDIDYPNRTFKGTSVNTLAALRSGVNAVTLHAGETLKISAVRFNGKSATYRREGRDLIVQTGTLAKGKSFEIAVDYSAKNSKAQPFGGGRGGFHWIEPTATDATRIGFWTQGETETNSEWIPTWDYPNDLATSQIKCTVQADWQMIGNGTLDKVTVSPDKKRKSYVWRMKQPHATYLLTMVGGPLDVKRDRWQGVDLWYVVPRGQANLIDSSFGNTKDMLTFFSQKLGVKYPWPKYAQNAMYDFGGGMENVSATTLGAGSLTDARDGYFRMDSLNSHELAHQWFGDLVTCKDWGDIWLNESFATFMQILYFEHSQGAAAYDWEIESAMQSYFAESRRYKRAISTKMYPNGDAMFDSHAYPKGGVVLHSLRRKIGDEAFFASLNAYLTQWKYTPVESSQLRRAFTETSGINAEPFWAQWLDKPGHPVLDYAYTADAGSIKLTVKQLQDTTDGTPVYDIDAKVGVILDGGKSVVLPVRLTKTEETFVLPVSGTVKAVIFDPAHDFLREIPKLNWSEAELPWILQYGWNAPDRAEAARRLVATGKPENYRLVTDAMAADKGVNPIFPAMRDLPAKADPALRNFWVGQLDHANFDRRASAVFALGKLPAESETSARIKALVNDKAPIPVVVAAINALATWDKAGYAETFRLAQKIKDRRNRIKAAADAALAKK